MKERWRWIPGYEGRYKVSDRGRVRSVDRYVRTVSKTGTEAQRLVVGRVLRPQKHSAGYHHVGLDQRVALIHLLVLLAFRGNVPRGKQGAHNDGDKRNNVLKNLRYATPKENQKDRYKHGTDNRGERNKSSKLTTSQVLKIRDIGTRIPQRALARRFGVSQGHVSRLRNKEQWSHI